MNLNDQLKRLLQEILEIGTALPLVITGGYAVQAHHIVDRFSRDIDMATDSAVAMEAIVATVVEGLTGRGWRVEGRGVGPPLCPHDDHRSRLRRAMRARCPPRVLDINRRLYAETY